MDETTFAEIRAFVAERDAVLLAGDLERLREFLRKNGETPSPDDRTMLASLHIARTGAKSLPMDVRVASKARLSERGMRSLDDGDIP